MYIHITIYGKNAVGQAFSNFCLFFPFIYPKLNKISIMLNNDNSSGALRGRGER